MLESRVPIHRDYPAFCHFLVTLGASLLITYILRCHEIFKVIRARRLYPANVMEGAHKKNCNWNMTKFCHNFFQLRLHRNPLLIRDLSLHCMNLEIIICFHWNRGAALSSSLFVVLWRVVWCRHFACRTGTSDLVTSSVSVHHHGQNSPFSVFLPVCSERRRKVFENWCLAKRWYGLSP
jgi:hypothetical protein